MAKSVVGDVEELSRISGYISTGMVAVGSNYKKEYVIAEDGRVLDVYIFYVTSSGVWGFKNNDYTKNPIYADTQEGRKIIMDKILELLNISDTH